ncbi:hypothetical protein BJ508DRAFT_378894 [Ascobolus immersus RN42]|uniref:Uncharacterized protein n=1 Tax=Ascobolus immersus RN42 TaxID=1160509 RepID=A0A3N4HZI6_ASCIM|nr:hypothetical protein BJ508DRAFT_378894 [Ascobolus immersus RN42]
MTSVDSIHFLQRIHAWHKRTTNLPSATMSVKTRSKGPLPSTPPPPLSKTAINTFTARRRSLLESISTTESNLIDSLESPYVHLPDALNTLHGYCKEMHQTAKKAEHEMNDLQRELIREEIKERWGTEWSKECIIRSIWDLEEWMGRGLFMGDDWRAEARRELVELCEKKNGIMRLTELLAAVINEVDVQNEETDIEWRRMKEVWDKTPFLVPNEKGRLVFDEVNMYR